MAYLTLSELQPKPLTKARPLHESKGLADQPPKVFLSYRRNDKDYIQSIVEMLQQQAPIYIDYLDEGLPDTPDVSTAKVLRQKIATIPKLLVLATPNSKDSRWIPWEMGLADGLHKPKNIAVFPITQNQGVWAEQEYFQLYGSIQTAQSRDGVINGWGVFFPDKTCEWLKDWLK